MKAISLISSPRVQAYQELTTALQLAARNDSVDFVILTGAGDYYSSGADMKPSEADVAVPLEEGIRLGR